MAKPTRSHPQTNRHSTASPSRPPVCNIKIEHDTRMCVVNYASMQAVAAVFEHITSMSAIAKYSSARSVILENGARLTTDIPIDDIIEFEDRDPDFNIEQYPQDVRAIEIVLQGRVEREIAQNSPVSALRKRRATSPAENTPNAASGGRSVDHSTRPKRPTAAAIDGGTPLAAICEQANIEPRIARQKLRKANEPKPANGWQFARDDIDRIIEIITRD